MEAYVIFAGGGVKGAALAGAFYALEQHVDEIKGFGGTSAGSIVATLGAVGFSAKEVQDVMIDLDFKSLLDDGGERLESIKSRISKHVDSLKSRWFLKRLWAGGNLAKMFKEFDSELGLYDGKLIEKFIKGKISEKFPELEKHAEISFNDLFMNGCKPLKIVASDISRSVPVLFSVNDTKHGSSVVEAVRASVSYPGVFKPVAKGDRYLVDGGIASNLPAFLFNRESVEKRIPTFAFDLISEESSHPPLSKVGLWDFSKRLINTSLEASDVLLRSISGNVIYVPISVSSEISTLDFWISKDQRQALFNQGFEQASSFLTSLDILKSSRAEGLKIKKQIQAQHGGPKRYDHVLKAVVDNLKEKSKKLEAPRACIILPTGRGTKMVAFTYGFRDQDSGRWHTDVDLELEMGTGGSGIAWTDRTMCAIDLLEKREFGLSAEQADKVPEDRKALLCVAIRGLWAHKLALDTSGEPTADITSTRTSFLDADVEPIGVLCVDTASTLDETGWVDNERPDNSVENTMWAWSHTLTSYLT